MRLWAVVLLAACGSGPPPPRERRPDAAITPLPPDPAPVPVGDLPVECGIYKALAGKVAACEQLGPQRKLLQDQFETSWKAWTSLPQTERGGVAAGCRAAADALRAALVPCS
jgi:hypothetical protein